MIATSCVLAALALGAWLFVRRTTVHVALEARGHRSGHWALAGGIASLGLALTVVVARDRALVIAVRIRNRAVWSRDSSKPRQPKRAKERVGVPWRSRGRWAGAALDFVWRIAQRIGIRRVDAGIELALDDVAVAAWIEGALSVVSALVSRVGHLRHDVRFAPEEHLGVELAVDVDFRPIHIVWDTIVVLCGALATRDHRRQPREATLVERTAS